MSSPPAAAPTALSKLASKRKTKKKHFVQQKVEVLRASDPVLSVLMWGVNHSVGVFPPPSPLHSSTHQPTQPHLTQASILLIMRRLTTSARCPCPSCCCQTTSEPAPRSKSTTTSSTSTVTACACRGTFTLHFISLHASYQRLQTSFSGTAIHFCTNNGRFCAPTITTKKTKKKTSPQTR